MALGEMTNLQTGNQKLKIRHGIKSVHMTRIIGRKRVLVPGHMGDSCFSPPTATPTQKRLQRRSPIKGIILNLLEALPQDILVVWTFPYFSFSFSVRNQNIVVMKHSNLNFFINFICLNRLRHYARWTIVI